MSKSPKANQQPVKAIRIDSAAKKAVLAGAAASVIIMAFYCAKWGFANTVSIRADKIEIAELAVALAPGDPQTHYAAAVLLEKSFDFADIQKALAEYEQAAGLSPENYLLWLELGRARERSGDAEGAERALRRAQELAPNYADVSWALGNALVRQGKYDEGFAQIRNAVAADARFTNAAATTAWQIFDGDLDLVRAALGDSPRLNAALALLLMGGQRVDEAMAVWNALPQDSKTTDLRETGETFLKALVAAKRFRHAARVASDLVSRPDAFVTGRITNGGFEDALKTQNAGPFEWQLGAGLYPQIAPTAGQKRSGGSSLVMIFNTNDAKDFRDLSQTVAVEPGRTYEFELFYRSDLKTPAVFRWQIVDPIENKVLAETGIAVPALDWSALRAKFTVPDKNDGVVLHLARENCGSVVCPVSGNLWFDDLSLRVVN